VLLAIKEVDSDLNNARAQALSACTGVESMGSAMASMPHYMAQGVNEAAARAIEAAVSGLEKTLMLALTGVEAIVVFVINMYIQTYTCLITAAVRASLETVIGATEDIASFLNETLGKIEQDIEQDAKSFQDALNSFIGKLNGIGNLFGSGEKIPTLSLSSLTELDSIQIPHSFQDKLDALNNSIPTFPEVQAAMEKVIRTPFELVKNEVNNTLTVYQFNRDVFTIPEKQKLTFCSDNPTINNFFDDLLHMIWDTRKILIGVIVTLAILAMIPMAYREWWNYRSLRQRAFMLSQLGQDFDPVDIVNISARPFSSTVGLKVASRAKSSRNQVLIRWFVAYITTPQALFVLSLGLAGLISVLGQYVILREVEKAAPALAAEVGQFADLVVDKLTEASETWANSTNSAINQTTFDINHNVLGWVETSTQTVNDTLNQFVSLMSETLNSTFGGTPLEQPIGDVINCLIGLKIAGIQKGLTWVHDNAQVSLPLVPVDTFSLGAAKSVGPDATGSDSFLSDTSSEASDKITDIVVKLADKWKKQLLQESLISAGVVGIWVIVFIIGLLRTCVKMIGRDKTRAEGGGGGNIKGFTSTDEHRQNVDEKQMQVHTQSPQQYGSEFDDVEDHLPPPSSGNVGMVGAQRPVTSEKGGWRRSSHGEITG